MNIQHVEGVHLCEFDKGRVALPNQMNFRKNSKGGTVGGGGGGGLLSIQKFVLQVFGNLNRAFRAGN